MEASAIKESLNEKLNKKGVDDPHQMFQANEILIGNYTFSRDSRNSDWTLAEISQVRPRLENGSNILLKLQPMRK